MRAEPQTIFRNSDTQSPGIATSLPLKNADRSCCRLLIANVAERRLSAIESLVLRDLRVYAGAHGGEVYHYRDNTGLEVDAVVETAAGEWLAAEAKLGGDKAIDTAARNLLKLRSRVDTAAVGEPSKLIVVTAVGSYCYDRPDGVAVVPITALGP